MNRRPLALHKAWLQATSNLADVRRYGQSRADTLSLSRGYRLMRLIMRDLQGQISVDILVPHARHPGLEQVRTLSEDRQHPAARRQAELSRLKSGEILIERLETRIKRRTLEAHAHQGHHGRPRP